MTHSARYAHTVYRQNEEPCTLALYPYLTVYYRVSTEAGKTGETGNWTAF